MAERGLITRIRQAVGETPNLPGDILLFAPPLVITDEEVDRMVAIVADSVEAAVRTPRL
jgi:adenosylmethionine-8-amino-7-oxononanoate aminotransferase